MDFNEGTEDTECNEAMEDTVCNEAMGGGKAWHKEVMVTMDTQTRCLNTQAIIIMVQNFTILLIKDIDQVMTIATCRADEAKIVGDTTIDKVVTETKDITAMKEMNFTTKATEEVIILTTMMEIMTEHSMTTDQLE